MNSLEKKIAKLESTIRNYYLDHSKITTDFLKFNKKIGLPKHPATFEEMPLMPYQIDFFHMQHNSTTKKFHINKARQIGFTELILRILLFEGFYKYKGGKVIIIAGTRFDTTKDIFSRFRDLTKNIGEFVLESTSTKLRLGNGTTFIGLPANPEAITGWTKVRAIFMDEAAKWDLINDKPVMNSIMPIVRSNKSDLFMISTPKGLRGFFYEIGRDENDFEK